ncbi:MAG: F0F1 ATP synthase subunit B' [Pseudomonadota bacterium]
MATNAESVAEAAASPEHGSGGLPQLDFDTWPSQIIWAAVALVVLYQLLAKHAIPRISGILEERADTIADDLDRAEEFRRRATEAEEAYDRALAEARSKAQAIAAETRAEVQKEIDEAIAKADAEIAARTAESEKRIAAIRDQASEAAAEVATEVAEALVSRLLPEAKNAKAIKSAVKSRI